MTGFVPPMDNPTIFRAPSSWSTMRVWIQGLSAGHSLLAQLSLSGSTTAWLALNKTTMPASDKVVAAVGGGLLLCDSYGGGGGGGGVKEEPV